MTGWLAGLLVRLPHVQIVCSFGCAIVRLHQVRQLEFLQWFFASVPLLGPGAIFPYVVSLKHKHSSPCFVVVVAYLFGFCLLYYFLCVLYCLHFCQVYLLFFGDKVYVPA